VSESISEPTRSVNITETSDIEELVSLWQQYQRLLTSQILSVYITETCDVKLDLFIFQHMERDLIIFELAQLGKNNIPYS